MKALCKDQSLSFSVQHPLELISLGSKFALDDWTQSSSWLRIHLIIEALIVVCEHLFIGTLNPGSPAGQEAVCPLPCNSFQKFTNDINAVVYGPPVACRQSTSPQPCQDCTPRSVTCWKLGTCIEQGHRFPTKEMEEVWLIIFSGDSSRCRLLMCLSGSLTLMSANGGIFSLSLSSQQNHTCHHAVLRCPSSLVIVSSVYLLFWSLFVIF